MPSTTSGNRLTVRAVHAQIVFASINGGPRNDGGWAMIDFLEAVTGMKLCCADLTDYIFIGDTATCETIVAQGDGMYAKKVTFDFNPADRMEKLAETKRDNYFTGIGVVEHAGDWFAGVRSISEPANASFEELLMPVSALTKDNIPIQMALSDVKLYNLVKPGDEVAYKVPRTALSEGLREKLKIVSARKRDH